MSDNFLEASLFRPTGYEAIAIGDTSTATAPTEDQLRSWALGAVGTLTADRTLRLPLTRGFGLVVANLTTGGQNLTVGGSTGSQVTLVPGEWASVICDGTNYSRVGASPTREARINLTDVVDEYTATEAEATADSLYFYGETPGDVAILLDGHTVPDGHVWAVKNATTYGVSVVKGGSSVTLAAGAAATAVHCGDDDSIIPTGTYYVTTSASPGLVPALPTDASKVLRGDGSWGHAGFATIAMADTNQTPSAATAANYVLRLTGALTANRDLVLPLTAGRSWHIINACTGAYSVVVKGSSGASTTVANGARALVVTDGVAFYS